MLFDEITTGNNGQCDLLLKGVQDLVAKNGQPYQAFTCADTSGNVKKVQNFNKLLDTNMVKLPLVISANVRADLYQNNKTFLLVEYKKGKLKVEDFQPKSQVDPRSTWSAMIKLIKTIENEPLCKLVCEILNKNKEKLKIMPLNTVAFNRVNGLMEATVKLMKLADLVSKEITFLNRDVLVAASSIFYIGQVYATNTEFEYTEEDVLLGPGVLTLQEIVKIEDKYKGEIDETTLNLLKHLVISRNKGHYCAVPEAVVLNHIDQILQETEEVNSILATLGDNGYVNRYYQQRSRLYKVPAEKEKENGKS